MAPHRLGKEDIGTPRCTACQRLLALRRLEASVVAERVRQGRAGSRRSRRASRPRLRGTRGSGILEWLRGIDTTDGFIRMFGAGPGMT